MRTAQFLALYIVCLALSSYVHAKTDGDVYSIHTIDAARKVGITSNVVLVHKNYKKENLGEAINGVLHLSSPIRCTQGMTLEVSPGSAWYNDATKIMECKPQEYVYLKLILFKKGGALGRKERVVTTIAKNITSAIRADDNALLALLYNELAAEINAINPILYQLYSKRVIKFYSQATNYPRDVLGAEISGKLSSDFLLFIRNRQLANNILGTGVLDYKTLSSEANRNIHWFRGRVYEDVTKVPTLDDQVKCAIAKFKIDRNYTKLNPIVKHLLKTAERKEQIGKYGDASLLFNEAYARGRASREAAEYAARKTFENVGKVLGVKSAVSCDPEQRKYVMTKEMVKAIKDYQKTNDIAVTGQVNYKTIRSFSESDIRAYLR